MSERTSLVQALAGLVLAAGVAAAQQPAAAKPAAPAAPVEKAPVETEAVVDDAGSFHHLFFLNRPRPHARFRNTWGRRLRRHLHRTHRGGNHPGRRSFEGPGEEGALRYGRAVPPGAAAAQGGVLRPADDPRLGGGRTCCPEARFAGTQFVVASPTGRRSPAATRSSARWSRAWRWWRRSGRRRRRVTRPRFGWRSRRSSCAAPSGGS